MAPRSGRKHPYWKGGTSLNREKHSPSSYLRITAGPQRGIYVHRLVAVAKIGRELEENEEVHHIDGNSLNNHPDNLRVYMNTEHPKKKTSDADDAIEALIDVEGKGL